MDYSLENMLCITLYNLNNKVLLDVLNLYQLSMWFKAQLQFIRFPVWSVYKHFGFEMQVIVTMLGYKLKQFSAQ